MAINSIHIPKQTGIIDLDPIEVTWTPLPSSLKKALGSDYATFSKYYESLPPLKTLEAFRLKYPSRPEINNLLTYAYIKKRKIKKANALIEENYRLNPTHILSTLNYADLCLRTKNHSQIPEIPLRKKLHISEFRAFALFKAHFHLQKKEKEKSEAFLYLAHRLDPNHPAVIALKNKLFPTKYSQVWKARLKKLIPQK